MVLVVGFALSAAGCSAGDTQTGDTGVTESQESVRVERRDLVEGLSLEATVEAGQRYAITAPARGSFHTVGAEGVPAGSILTEPRAVGFSFLSEHGEVIPLDVPETAAQVTILAPEEIVFEAGTPLLEITDAALLLRALPDPEALLRIGQRSPARITAQVRGSAGPFSCGVTDPRLSRIGEDMVFTCRPPAEVPVVVGAEARIVIVLEERRDVLALPIEAVAGTLERGEVFPRTSHGRAHSVTLGISDGAYVEIVDGLSEGMEVLIPSPTLLGAE